jgi:AcrR family transcriptional regulator
LYFCQRRFFAAGNFRVDSPTNAEALKRSRVLDGAMQVFLAYGYQRVTMDDIARSVDMSRPALYLLFKNKADIYRAIADRMFEASLENIRVVLAGKGSLAERLTAAVDREMIGMMAQITTSPHGAEILDLKNSLAADLVGGWHNAVAAVFRDAIAADARKRGVDLAARGLAAAGLAEMLLDGLEGMKHRVSDIASQRDGARQLVRVVELAIAG